MAFARTTTLTPESVEAVAALRAAIMDAMRAASVASGAASPAAGASARALGGDGEPVANVAQEIDRAYEEGYAAYSSIHGLAAVRRPDESALGFGYPTTEERAEWKASHLAPIYARLYTRPAATGDTVGAAARALVKAAIYARADEAVTGIIVPEAEWDALLAALRSTPGGGACG